MTTLDLKVGEQIVRNVSQWSYTEDSTPLDGSDTSGAAADLTLGFPTRLRPAQVARMGAQPVSTIAGQPLGTVDGTGVTDGVASLSVGTRATKLSVIRRAKPFAGSLAGAIGYWVSLTGVADGITVDPAIAIRPVTTVGWKANVWLQIKLFCAAQQVEAVLVGGDLIVRPPRIRRLDVRDASSAALGVDESMRCRRITVSYYRQDPIEPGDVVLDYSRTNLAGNDPDAQFRNTGGTRRGSAANGDYPTGATPT